MFLLQGGGSRLLKRQSTPKSCQDRRLRPGQTTYTERAGDIVRRNTPCLLPGSLSRTISSLPCSSCCKHTFLNSQHEQYNTVCIEVTATRRSSSFNDGGGEELLQAHLQPVILWRFPLEIFCRVVKIFFIYSYRNFQLISPWPKLKRFFYEKNLMR